MTLIADLITRLTTLTTGWRKSTALGELVGCHSAVDQAIDHTLEQASKIASAFKRHEPSHEDKNWEGQPLAAALPKGLVIYGQGCGCGGLARNIAKEINAHFIAGITCNPSGETSGAQSIAHYFSQAKEMAQLAADGRPVMLYLSGANFLTSVAAEQEQEQALEAQATSAEIARQIENLSTNSNVLVMIEAHTLSQIDSALLADGRFDVQIEVEKPDYKGRLAIFQHHTESYHDLPKTAGKSQKQKQQQRVQILVSLDGAWEEERQAELDQICQNCAVLANGLYADQIYRALFQLRAQAAIKGSVTAEELYQAIETQQGKP